MPQLGDRPLVIRTRLAVEEICTYIHENCGADNPVDIMEGLSINEVVLVKLFHIRHEYIFGMNSTTLTAGGGYEK